MPGMTHGLKVTVSAGAEGSCPSSHGRRVISLRRRIVALLVVALLVVALVVVALRRIVAKVAVSCRLTEARTIRSLSVLGGRLALTLALATALTASALTAAIIIQRLIEAEAVSQVLSAGAGLVHTGIFIASASSIPLRKLRRNEVVVVPVVVLVLIIILVLVIIVGVLVVGVLVIIVIIVIIVVPVVWLKPLSVIRMLVEIVLLVLCCGNLILQLLLVSRLLTAGTELAPPLFRPF